MAHSLSHYQEMGRLVAQAGTLPWDELVETCGHSLMEGLKVMTTPGKHANVLQHVIGFLKDKLSQEDKSWRDDRELTALLRQTPQTCQNKDRQSHR